MEEAFVSLPSISSKALLVQNIRGNPASFQRLYADMIPRGRSPDGSINAARIKTATCCSDASDGRKPSTPGHLEKKQQPLDRSSGGKSNLLARDNMRISGLYEHEQARNKIGMLSIPFPESLEMERYIPA
uniref:Uncharacterized protein n=1 Tax=Arundo donax TaxID=35708 RepID=A0A0A9CVN8_ARUDO